MGQLWRQNDGTEVRVPADRVELLDLGSLGPGQEHLLLADEPHDGPELGPGKWSGELILNAHDPQSKSKHHHLKNRGNEAQPAVDGVTGPAG